MNVQEIVLKIRKKSGLSQQKFADLAGLYRTSVSQFELGTRVPKPSHAKKYIVAAEKYKLKIGLDDFYL